MTRAALAALVAECESERARLGELLVAVVEACPGGVSWWVGGSGLFNAEDQTTGAVVGGHATLPDALRALLAKVEGPS